ncbi:diguanylate cyclase [Pseudomonas nunensis]|uniref:diguanylate cyclase n=1 Tax=Pseudomonas nunensis TaxID=2961896 RepID=A0ABY5EKY5_9PSED|nr:diguanylate cyclase [Pseudomonas nunensis]KOX99705.1 response regulator [Pseudomonas nunensis]KPN90146.1 response regulator [Pseudomonas nunensis]MCL5225061.1 diguanylate cyclase [Pseudomonas nunensis]UTO16386.1 diguanylate cyclase [Pseudomonas nunensis]
MKPSMETGLPHSHNRPKLLIVDDQPTNIRVLHELFREDFDVFMATSGEQAITVCHVQQPDLILLDVVMEGMDGYEVCRRLKADTATQGIPIIFITAQQQESEELLGLELGAVDFISKPINPVIVKARVRTHLTLKLQSDLLRSMAMMDGLTGVANRRKFDEDISADWRLCFREQKPLSLILADVDFFKRYNDRYGHQAGDGCLKSVARALSETVGRPYDLVARYGGEEFACVLPKTDLSGAVEIAQRMQERVRALGIEHSASDVDRVVTISLGVATLTPSGDLEYQALIEAADKQLYEAKSAGRGRVCSSAMEPS